jgi:hypothetical protein
MEAGYFNCQESPLTFESIGSSGTVTQILPSNGAKFQVVFLEGGTYVGRKIPRRANSLGRTAQG